LKKFASSGGGPLSDWLEVVLDGTKKGLYGLRGHGVKRELPATLAMFSWGGLAGSRVNQGGLLTRRFQRPGIGARCGEEK